MSFSFLIRDKDFVISKAVSTDLISSVPSCKKFDSLFVLIVSGKTNLLATDALSQINDMRSLSEAQKVLSSLNDILCSLIGA